MDYAGTEVEDEVDMARRATRESRGNPEVVASLLAKLEAAKLDKDEFEVAVASIESDKTLKPADVVAIAERYAVAGVKVTSRKSALEKIRKRFVELRRAAANLKVAEKARPW